MLYQLFGVYPGLEIGKKFQIWFILDIFSKNSWNCIINIVHYCYFNTLQNYLTHIGDHPKLSTFSHINKNSCSIVAFSPLVMTKINMFIIWLRQLFMCKICDLLQNKTEFKHSYQYHNLNYNLDTCMCIEHICTRKVICQHIANIPSSMRARA